MKVTGDRGTIRIQNDDGTIIVGKGDLETTKFYVFSNTLMWQKNGELLTEDELKIVKEKVNEKDVHNMIEWE